MSVNRGIDPVEKEPCFFVIDTTEEASDRFWRALHYYQDGNRMVNPYAEPLVSSSSKEATGYRITTYHPFLLRVVALAAGVELQSCRKPRRAPRAL